MFRLPLQKVSCSLSVKFVGLFNDSMEVVSARIGHGTACSRSVETTKGIYPYRVLENTPRFKKINLACNLMRNVCTV